MSLLSPFRTFEIPLSKDKIIGTKMQLSSLPNCRRCGQGIQTHGYEFAGTVKIKEKNEKAGSFVLCPSCYFDVAKRIFICNSLREASILLFIGWLIIGVTGFLLGKTIINIIAGIVFAIWFVVGIFKWYYREYPESVMNSFASYIAGISFLDTVHIESMITSGLPYFTSPRDQVVPCPIAILVHRDNPMDNITTKQIVDIFSGQIKTWQVLELQDKAINIYAPKQPCRESSAFRTNLLNGAELKNVREVPASLIMAESLRNDPQGIGFALYSHYDLSRPEQQFKILKVDDEDCRFDNGRYPLWVLPEVNSDSGNGKNHN